MWICYANTSKVGADVHYHDEKYGTALFEAIRCRHPQTVELLLEHGTAMDTDSDGEAGLEYALRFQNDEIISLLLNAGARLQSHALPHFKIMLSEYLKRRGLQNDTTAA
jgi:ankyrin repeat protein